MSKSRKSVPFPPITPPINTSPSQTTTVAATTGSRLKISRSCDSDVFLDMSVIFQEPTPEMIARELSEKVKEVISESRSVAPSPSPSREIAAVAKGYDVRYRRYSNATPASYDARFGMLPLPLGEVWAMNATIGKILALKRSKGEPLEISLRDYGSGNGRRFLHYYLSLAAKGVTVKLQACDISTTALEEYASFLMESGSFASQVNEFCDFAYWGLTNQTEDPKKYQSMEFWDDQRTSFVNAINCLLSKKLKRDIKITYPKDMKELEGFKINLGREVLCSYAGEDGKKFLIFLKELQDQMGAKYPLDKNFKSLPPFELQEVKNNPYERTILKSGSMTVELVPIAPNAKPDDIFEQFPEKKVDLTLCMFGVLSHILDSELRQKIIDKFKECSRYGIILTLPFRGKANFYQNIQRFDWMRHLLSQYESGQQATGLGRRLSEEEARIVKEELKRAKHPGDMYYIPGTLEMQVAEFCQYLSSPEQHQQEVIGEAMDAVLGKKLVDITEILKKNEKDQVSLLKEKVIALVNAFRTECCDRIAALQIGWAKESIATVMNNTIGENLTQNIKGLEDPDKVAMLAQTAPDWAGRLKGQFCKQLASQIAPDHNRAAADALNRTLGNGLSLTAQAFDSDQLEKTIPLLIDAIKIKHPLHSLAKEIPDLFKECMEIQKIMKETPEEMRWLQQEKLEKTQQSLKEALEAQKPLKEAFKFCLFNMKSQLANRSLVRGFEETKETPYHLYTMKEASDAIKDTRPESIRWRQIVYVDAHDNPENISKNAITAVDDALNATMRNLGGKSVVMPNYMLVKSESQELQGHAVTIEGERLMKEFEPHALFSIITR